MLTDSQVREMTGLLNRVSADTTIHPSLLVEAIREHDNIHALLKSWLFGGYVEYSVILNAFNEVF